LPEPPFPLVKATKGTETALSLSLPFEVLWILEDCEFKSDMLENSRRVESRRAGLYLCVGTTREMPR
jgi:hypothetical protein